MGSRKVNTEDIDEELLVSSIGRRKQDGFMRPAATDSPALSPEEGEDTGQQEALREQALPKEKAGKEGSRRKRQGNDYDFFLLRNEIKTRQCVYISHDVHHKILKIVNDIAGREITVGGYVDIVLRQHLEQYKDRINELYRKQREDLI